MQPAKRTIDGVELSAGTWHLTAAGDGPLRLSARRQSDGAAATRVPDGVKLMLEEAGPVQIAVMGSKPAFLTEVVARRVD